MLLEKVVAEKNYAATSKEATAATESFVTFRIKDVLGLLKRKTVVEGQLLKGK